MGIMERCSRSAPCIFCGDVGYDMRVHYPEKDDTVHWCHKTTAAKGELVTAGGETYICIASKHRGAGDIGEFDLFKKYLSKEEWMARQEATNPNWKSPGRKSSGRAFSHRDASELITYDSSEPAKGEEKPLPNRQLDKIYRRLLALLVLEDKHKSDLLEEWKSPIHDVSHLLAKYPIRSMPPEDSARYKSKEHFKNASRKKIVTQLLKEFGDLRGVPGFYLRSGNYWKDKPENERWTISSPEGIIFPCFDKDGYLYRIRIKDDYPDYSLKEGTHHPICGKWGTLSHSYDYDTGEHLWTFYPKDRSEPILVYGKGQKQICLNQKGNPTEGKVNGKYKNISSVSTRYENGLFYNTMEGGSRSGSPYSLYVSEGDSYRVVLGTEGEKKGMVGNEIRHNPVVSSAGVWCYREIFRKDENGISLIDYLKSKGMKVFVLCYDADKSENDDVKKAEAAFIEALKENGVMPMIGNWKSRFDKGLDDILLLGLDIMVSRV